jgi:hypothetical protein
MAGLKNVEEVFNNLVKHPDDVVTTPLEAAEIWTLFKGYPIDSGRLDRLDYRAFLQAALIAAIDASGPIGFVESLWKAAVKPNATVKSIIKKLLKDSLKRYYRNHIKGEAPPIYQMAISAIIYECSFYFDAINQGLDL